MKVVPDKTLLRVWRGLPSLLGAAAAESATLAEPELARTWTPSGKRYYAELELVEPRTEKLWMSFDLQIAIACAGQLVMRPKNATRGNISSSTFDGDDLDAMGECVNTFCAGLNEAVRAELGDDHRIVFRSGGLQAPDPSSFGPFSVASGKLELGNLATGGLELIVPDAVFVAAREQENDGDGDGDGDDEADEADEADDDGDDGDGAAPSELDGSRDVRVGAPSRTPKKSPKRAKQPKRGADDDDSGPLLSAEELAAIREATTSMGKGVAVIVADRATARDIWRELLASTGVEFELVANHHQLLATCRARNVDVVVIDADACVSGGLTLLAAIRGGIGVPSHRVVVAGLPTHSHLIACFAGGATDYVARPLDDETLGRVLHCA